MSMVLLGPAGRVNLSIQTYAFGSAPDNQFVLNDAKVSPRHAVLQFQGQGYAIVDLGSTTGTYLNEQQLMPEMSVILQNGDRIRIGDTLYVYEMSTPGQPDVPAYPPVLAQSGPPESPQAVQGSLPDYGQSGSPASPSTIQALSPDYRSGSQLPLFGGDGQSNPAYPALSSSPLYLPPVQSTDPYTGQFPPYTPQPGLVYPRFPHSERRRGGSKALILVLVLVLVLGGGIAGLVLYLNRPQPVITVNSAYKAGTVYIGASSTSFEIIGHKFSGMSVITFLLDGSPAPGSQAAYSDSNGNVTTVLKVANEWPVGNHILTARDASGYITAAGVGIKIVTPGQSHTPGPGGAPSDDASGTIDVTIMASDGTLGKITLTVTGGPNGGTVCSAEADGQSHTNNGTSQGVAYTQTETATCSGTYKGGKLSYTETVTSQQIVFDNGLSCTVQVPYVVARLDGQFTSETAIDGNFNGDPITVTCNMGVGTNTTAANQGTWTGLASMH